MGCLRSLGCLVLLVVIVAAGWIFRASWLPLLHRGVPPREKAAPAVVTWEALTLEGAARAKDAVQKLGTRSGPVFANLSAGDLTAYVYEELSKQLPPSAQNVQAAIIDDQLYIRATIKLSDFGGTTALGPLASVLSERESVQFGGTLDIVRPGLAQYRIRSLRIRELSIPTSMIPKLLKNVTHGTRPQGVSDDALPLVVPSYIADVRIRNKKITLYKAVS
jgi:hypothetical protein